MKETNFKSVTIVTPADELIPREILFNEAIANGITSVTFRSGNKFKGGGWFDPRIKAIETDLTRTIDGAFIDNIEGWVVDQN